MTEFLHPPSFHVIPVVLHPLLPRGHLLHQLVVTLFFSTKNLDGVSVKFNENVTTSGPPRTRLTGGRTDARRARARRRTARAKRRVEGRGRAQPNLEAEEATFIKASQVSVHVHPSSSSPNCMPKIVIQRVVVGKSVILLGGGQDVQGEAAPQGNHELIHFGEPGQQHKRDEDVSAQEQDSVAGVVFLIIGRGVTAAGPHGKAGESLTQNFAPLDRFECLRVRLQRFLSRLRRQVSAAPEEHL